MRRYVLASLLAVLLVSAPAAAETIVTVDADHGLADHRTMVGYTQDGFATADVAAPSMRLTVAESHADVGVRGFRLDFDSQYLRVQYNETIERTVRFYIPSEYWYPLTSLGQSPIRGNTSADFRPTAEGRYTAVTIHFEGQTDVVYEVSKVSSGVFWGRSRASQVVENATGYDPPRIGSGGEWAYIPNGTLSNRSSYRINQSSNAVTIQYDAASGEETSWQPVTSCDGDEPVCYYQRAGVDDSTFVLSKTVDAPPVRYKSGRDVTAIAKGGYRDARSIPERVSEFIDDLFGGS